MTIKKLLFITTLLFLFGNALPVYASCAGVPEGGTDPETGRVCMTIGLPPATSVDGTPTESRSSTDLRTGSVSCAPGQKSDGTCIESGPSTVPTTGQTSGSGSVGSTPTPAPTQTQTTSGVTGNTPAFCNKGICSYIPLEPLPGQNINGSGPQTGTSSFPALLAAAFKLLVTLGSLFAVVMIVISGISYMLSETPLAMEKAKERAWAAMKGLLLLGAAWLIIYTINPKLLNFDLLSSDLKKSASTAGVPGAQNAILQQTAVPTDQQVQDCQNRGGVMQYQASGLTCVGGVK